MFIIKSKMDENMCRVCLNKSASISVFDKENDIQYCSKIMRCVNIVISEEDNYPKMICGGCANELSVCFEFVIKCEASDKALRCMNMNIDLYPSLDSDLDVDFKDEEIKTELEQYDISNDVGDINFPIEEDLSVQETSVKQKSKHKKKIKKSKTEPIQCVICGQLAISHSAMKTHMRTHTGEKPFACKQCDASYPTKGGLKRHIVTYHTKRERKFTCETCGNSFFTKNDIITHMRIHTDEKPYMCPFCPKSFRQIASLIRHKRTHTGEKPFPCDLCGKKFSDKNLVKKHQLVHTDEKKYSCHLCNKSVKSKTALTTHLNLHSNEKRNICSYCGMAFSIKGNLQTHIRRIHSERSGECSICLKTFSDLGEHLRKHTGEKPFTCTLCNQAFATKRSLSHHVVFKHENASKFKCSIGECAKTFPTAMMLEFHLLKQHTNHTPYVCQHCARGFFRTSDLSRHLRVSHMDVQMKLVLKTE